MPDVTSPSWRQGLASAPKSLPDNVVLVARLPGDEGIVGLVWRFYDPDDAEEIGQDGYWDFTEELISDATGGVLPSDIEGAWWTLVSLPPR